MRRADRSGRRRQLLRAVGALAGAVAAGGPSGPLAPAAAATATPASDGERPFSFGFIGDTPYHWFDELALRRVLEAMGDEPLDFVLHAGDIKSSGEPCSDALLADRLALLDRCPHPLILTPGDNDWTDCAPALRPDADGGALERLDWLRRQVYAAPLSLGVRRMAVEQQIGGLPENLRWRIGSLLFCTLHVVGSNNGASRAPALRRAWSLRQQANAHWLTQTVELAQRQQARGLVLAMHANMRFERDRADGWEMMRQLVIAAASAFKGPVLLLHGDTHRFRSDRLLLQSHGLANLHRVECFGSPFSASWVSIRWNPAAATPAGPQDSATIAAGAPGGPFEVSTRTVG